jgi:hypothetical protein
MGDCGNSRRSRAGLAAFCQSPLPTAERSPARRQGSQSAGRGRSAPSVNGSNHRKGTRDVRDTPEHPGLTRRGLLAGAGAAGAGLAAASAGLLAGPATAASAAPSTPARLIWCTATGRGRSRRPTPRRGHRPGRRLPGVRWPRHATRFAALRAGAPRLPAQGRRPGRHQARRASRRGRGGHLLGPGSLPVCSPTSPPSPTRYPPLSPS